MSIRSKADTLIPVQDSSDQLDHFIGTALERQGLSIRSFAQMVGVTHVFVIRVRQGKALFPPEHFQRWCAALALDAEQRDVFLRLTLLARCPPEIRALVSSLEQRVAQRERLRRARRGRPPAPAR